jgi:hypothetical protein
MILIKTAKLPICKPAWAGNIEIYWRLPALASHGSARLHDPQ